MKQSLLKVLIVLIVSTLACATSTKAMAPTGTPTYRTVPTVTPNPCIPGTIPLIPGSNVISDKTYIYGYLVWTENTIVLLDVYKVEFDGGIEPAIEPLSLRIKFNDGTYLAVTIYRCDEELFFSFRHIDYDMPNGLFNGQG